MSSTLPAPPLHASAGKRKAAAGVVRDTQGGGVSSCMPPQGLASKARLLVKQLVQPCPGSANALWPTHLRPSPRR